jgi:hypothetical protein
MAKYVTMYAYAKKHKLSVDTLKRWVLKGKVPHIVNKVVIDKILIKEDLRIK